MVIIYLASGTPSTSLPDYGVWDTVIKKGGHMLGYALLFASLWMLRIRTVILERRARSLMQRSAA